MVKSGSRADRRRAWPKTTKAVQSGHPRGYRGNYYQSFCRNRSAVGAGPADRRLAPVQRSPARPSPSGPVGRARSAGSGSQPTGGARRFLRPVAATAAADPAPAATAAPAAAQRPATRRRAALRPALGGHYQAWNLSDRAGESKTFERPQPAGRYIQRHPGATHRSGWGGGGAARPARYGPRGRSREARVG